MGCLEFIPDDHAMDEIYKIFLALPVNGSHYPKVEIADYITGQDKDIAGMRVCMEKTVIKYLFQDQVGPLAVMSFRSRPSASMRSISEALIPSIYSMVSTRSVVVSRKTFGT